MNTPFESVDIKCEQCEKPLHFDSVEGWMDKPEAKGWVRFQSAEDHTKPTPWFCCIDHLIEWVQKNK